jgi:lipoprotein-anchoring transpeptidase ErfK/SrfK
VSAINHARLCGVLASLAMLAMSAAPAGAQALSFAPIFRFETPIQRYAPQEQSMPRYAPTEPSEGAVSDELPVQLRRQTVAYESNEPPGTIVIDTAHTFLYLTLGRGQALRYGIGVGRQGFTWSGVQNIVRKAEWPDWIPPAQMVARQPYLPRWVGGGPGNPLGARALYLGSTEYRIHGTNDPTSIGKHVSSGCIRLQNADIIDLYSRVGIGTRVVVLANDQRRASSAEGDHIVLQQPTSGRMSAQIAAQPAAPQAARAVSTNRTGLPGLY